MENFDGNQRNVREKSVYLLHLDTPRIILIASVIIGIIAASFLFGMNFIKKGESDSLRNELISSANRPNIPFDAADPGLPVYNEHEPMGINPEKSSGLDIAESKTEPDLLTADNIKEIIPPFKEEKTTAAARVSSPAVARKTSDITPANSTKTEKTKKSKSNPAKKQKVVEVSITKPEKPSPERSGFAIQVAAFDTKGKADNEIRSLKNMSYDAFMEKSTVSGKTFYRVKVGPVSSKSKALDLLHEIQEKPNYRASYITSN